MLRRKIGLAGPGIAGATDLFTGVPEVAPVTPETAAAPPVAPGTGWLLRSWGSTPRGPRHP